MARILSQLQQRYSAPSPSHQQWLLLLMHSVPPYQVCEALSATKNSPLCYLCQWLIIVRKRHTFFFKKKIKVTPQLIATDC